MDVFINLCSVSEYNPRNALMVSCGFQVYRTQSKKGREAWSVSNVRQPKYGEG